MYNEYIIFIVKNKFFLQYSNFMTRKRKIELIPWFKNFPNDVIYEVLSYDDRFYLSNGKWISCFSKKDYRYTLLSKIPKINCIWNLNYHHGNIISYMSFIVYLSKNKKNRYSLCYYHDETKTDILKFVFRNHRSYEEITFVV